MNLRENFQATSLLRQRPRLENFGGIRKLRENFQGIAFGLMDGVVTLLGILIGLSEATGSAKIVIVGGLIGGVANSFGNAIGFYSSEQAERGQQLEFKKKKRHKDSEAYVHSHSEILFASTTAFAASLLALVFPIIPFFVFADVFSAMFFSFGVSIVMLFFLGYYIGGVNYENKLKIALKYVLIGVIGAGIAFAIGDLLKHTLVGT